MDRFLAALGQRSAAQDAMQGQPKWGTVQSVDPATGAAKVLLQPDNVLTGWLPTLSMVTGGATILSLPTQGEQVFLIPDSGEADSYVIAGHSFSNLTRPPQIPAAVSGANTAVKPGEVAIIAAGGAVFRMSGTTIFMRGNLVVDGDVSDRTGKLDVLRQHFNTHKHTGVTAGAALSGITDRTDPT